MVWCGGAQGGGRGGPAVGLPQPSSKKDRRVSDLHTSLNPSTNLKGLNIFFKYAFYTGLKILNNKKRWDVVDPAVENIPKVSKFPPLSLMLGVVGPSVVPVLVTI